MKFKLLIIEWAELYSCRLEASTFWVNMLFVKNEVYFLLSLQIKFLIQRCCSASFFFFFFFPQEKESDGTALGFGAYSTSENIAG